MDKLKMQTADKVQENIKKIGEIFPSCITERKSGGVLQNMPLISMY